MVVIALRKDVRYRTALFYKLLHYSYLIFIFNMASTDLVFSSILFFDCILLINSDVVNYDEWNGFVRPVISSEYSTMSPGTRSFDFNSHESGNRFKKETAFEEEIQNLLVNYPQNQDLIRNIGASYYQIIYPVQIHHHEKVSVSTRGTVPSKMGKHYHKTSLLIKAFNYKFRLDLELNTHLLAPNLIQKHYLAQGAEQLSKQEIEHCYYHGTVKDIPGASAAFQTCNGISGVIHIGNETFVIHPFYAGDMSKHPHVIFESNARVNTGCANKGNLEWRIKSPGRKPKHANNFYDHHQSKRDVREATKYVEMALIVDRSMFERRNGTTRAIVIQDSLQIANIVDLYYRRINTRVSVVYIETWQGANQVAIDRNLEISRSLMNFNDYVTRQLFSVDRDIAHLITGETFLGNEAGIAVPESVCTAKSLAVVADLNPYEPHITAATMAHMIGHNIGMGHDDERRGCFCQDWHGCIMQQTIVGLENIYPYTFSDCSLDDYIKGFRESRSMCLLNKPNEIISPHHHCGNKIVEENEDCDCGSVDTCEEIDQCCDPITCKLKKESECSATSACCEDCRFRSFGTECRPSTNECDISEYCSGDSGECPTDVHLKNGSPCDKSRGYCFNGICPTLDKQCEQIWGGIGADEKCYDQINMKGSIDGNCGVDDNKRYKRCEPENVFCGSLQCSDGNKNPNAELNHGHTRTVISFDGVDYECKSTYSKTNFTTRGLTLNGTPCGDHLICINQTCVSLFPYLDKNKCPSNHKHLECSSNGVCSNINTCLCNGGWTGHDCSVQDIRPPAVVAQTTISTIIITNSTSHTDSLESQMKNKTTIYENAHSTNTVNLVGVLMIAVGGVFTLFTTMALCYRSVVVHKSFCHCLIRRTTMPKVKAIEQDAINAAKAKQRKSDALPASESEEIIIDIPPERNLNYPRTPSCGHRRGSSNSSDSRVFYRAPCQHGPCTSAIEREHINNHCYRPVVKKHTTSGSDITDGRGTECKYSHRSYRDDAGSVISLRSDGMSKIPEKGILKKSYINKEDYWRESSLRDFYMPSSSSIAAATAFDYRSLVGSGSGAGGGGVGTVGSAGISSVCSSSRPSGSKVGGSTSKLYQSTTASGGGATSGARPRQKSFSHVEKTLKNLNGYHESILAAFKNASNNSKCPACASSIGTSYSTDNLIRHSSTSVLVGSKRSRSQEPLCDNSGADIHIHGTGSESGHTAPHTMRSSRYHLGRRRQIDDNVDPIRIRNLEDLIRQLEHHSGRHVDVQNLTLEDIRVSEPEADRQYADDAPEDDMSEEQFVFGQFRHPSRSHTHSYYSSDHDHAYDSSATDPTHMTRNVLIDMHPLQDYDNEYSSHRPLMRSASEELIPIGQNA